MLTPPPDRYRYCFIERPRCPRCDCTRYKTIRTSRDGETTWRRTHCLNRKCRHRYIVVIE
jgi:hypothetical protein